MKQVAFIPLVLVVGACDPGWSYEVPDAERDTSNGLRFRVEAAPGLNAVLHAHAFTGKINVEVTLERTDPSRAISYAPTPLRVVDATGALLPNYTGDPDRITCSGARVSAETGAVPITGSCTIDNRFAITPLVPRAIPGFHKPNPDLRTISVSVPGVSYEGTERTIRLDAKWDAD